MRREHHPLSRPDVPDVPANGLDHANPVGPDGEPAGRRMVDGQFSLHIGFQVRHQRRCLDPHQHAAGTRVRRAHIPETEFATEPIKLPGFHAGFSLCCDRLVMASVSSPLWTAALGKTIMRSRALIRPDAFTFRHAHHEFPVTIKAVVFDAYGTLYDIQSVAAVTEQAFPGYGEIITQIWRIKQLEYTWLRSLMRRYEDFSVITRDSLAYTLKVLGLKYDSGAFERIMDKYLHLDLYPDAAASLSAMKDRKLAILSNGSPDMLTALVRNSGLDRVLDATISVDSQKIFKPSPDAYALIESTLGVAPADVLFVSSNPWDACGAKAFGLKVAWIERAYAPPKGLRPRRRVTPQAM